MSKSNWNILFGLALLLVGAAWLLNNLGAIYFDFGDVMARAWPVAIIILGLWLLAGSRPKRVERGDRSARQLSHGVGDIDYAPGEIDKEGLEVKVSAGEVHLDLTGTTLTLPESMVEVKIGFGDIEVKAPKDVPIWVEGRTGIGDLYLLDRHADGFGARLEYKDNNYTAADRKLRIVAKAGLGDVRVMRA